MPIAERWLAHADLGAPGAAQLALGLRRVRRAAIGAALLWLVLVGLGAWALTERQVHQQVAALAAAAQLEAAGSQRSVDRLFVEMSSFAKVVARQASVHELMRHLGPDAGVLAALPRPELRDRLRAIPLVQANGEFFAAVAADLDYSRIFVADAGGRLVASNDSAKPDTILGDQIAQRRYFVDAMQGGSGRLYAAGQITAIPGFFFAARIEGEGGLPLGVAVVKKDAAALSPLLHGGYTTMIVDADGVIVAASQAGLLMRRVEPYVARTAPDDDAAARERLARERLEPLGIELPARRWHDGHWVVEGTPALITRVALADRDYSLLTLTRLDGVPALIQLHVTIALLVALVGLLLAAVADRLVSQWLRQRHAERRLADELTAFLQAMIDCIPNPIFYKGPDLRLLGCNGSYEAAFGVRREDIVGKSVLELPFLPEEHRVVFQREQQEALERGVSISRQIELPFADASTHSMLMSISAFHRADGAPAGVVGVLVDVTPLERTQQELRQAKEAAEAANRAKGEFLANMSHEVRTPMNSVLGMAHLALQSGLTPKQHNYLTKLERSARLLLGILNDILDFSKIEAGKLDLEQVEFEIGEVLDHLASVVGLAAEDKGLELLFVQAPGLPQRLVGDPLRLGQVLVNLGTNAVKFTERGEVVVGVEPAGPVQETVLLRFTVRDSGVGIDEQQRAQLFQPFVQADSSISRRYGGTGLGLAISRHLVQRMGGEIGADSVPGSGSCFWFTARFGVAPGAAPAPAAGLSLVRVLVVDDNASARSVLSDMARTLGMHADAVHDGASALHAVDQASREGRPYDLMLLDWTLPRPEAVECLRRLRAGDAPHRPTVLMTTVFSREEAVRDLAEAGVAADDVLVKPVTPSSLFDACAGVIGLARPSTRSLQQEQSLAQQMARLGGVRLLLVEDNPFNQELAVELLEQAGVDVTLAADGREAIECLERGRFDGVLMDCQMPGMDGYAATREIRSRTQWRELPIIAMTANAMAGDRELALAAGMNDHIAKPLDIRAMFDTIARWVVPAHAD